MTKTYIVSPITQFNDYEELWETKVGTNQPDMPLHFTVWGKTEEESRLRAEGLATISNKI